MEVDNKNLISVEVAYAPGALPDIVEVRVKRNTTIKEVIELSGMLKQYPELDLEVNKTGVFGKLRGPEMQVKDGDRIEIYRPLKADPKETRRKRARSQTKS